VMSFNPLALRWFARHLSLWRARPDFLAYDIRDLPSRFATAQRSQSSAEKLATPCATRATIGSPLIPLGPRR
ncbi:MAG TPA: hypothetical protein VJM09_01690, partial [Sphingobium sp.]|nr:hypothetical protein [Sphingobium sp.]